jgi:protein-L-isoaspartate(D-aspartate) O-methyltransferase
VIGVEIDPDLAARSLKNLSAYSNVEVIEASGAEYQPPEVDAIFVNAGATHARPAWIQALRPGGRLLFPLTIGANPQSHGSGFMIQVKREEGGYSVRFVSSVMIFPCVGARDEESNQKLLQAVQRGTWSTVHSLRVDEHESGETCWLHGEGVCLSIETVVAG